MLCLFSTPRSLTYRSESHTLEPSSGNSKKSSLIWMRHCVLDCLGGSRASVGSSVQLPYQEHTGVRFNVKRGNLSRLHSMSTPDRLEENCRGLHTRIVCVQAPLSANTTAIMESSACVVSENRGVFIIFKCSVITMCVVPRRTCSWNSSGVETLANCNAD